MRELYFSAAFTLCQYIADKYIDKKIIKPFKYLFLFILTLFLFSSLNFLFGSESINHSKYLQETISGEFIECNKEDHFAERLKEYLGEEMSLNATQRKEIEKQIAHYKAEGQRYYKIACEISPMIPNEGDRSYAMTVLTYWAGKSAAGGNWSFCATSALGLFLTYAWSMMDKVLEIEANLEKSKICFDTMEFYQYALING